MPARKIYYLLYLILFAAALIFSYGYFSYRKVVANSDAPLIFKGVEYTPTPTPDPLAPRNIAILGYAGGNHEGALLTDTIIIAHVIPRQDQVVLISIPRDIWVELAVTSEMEDWYKINAAYAIGTDDINYPDKPDRYTGKAGGGNMAKDVLSEVSGLPIHHFVAINFQGFKNIVNILGGVTVEVPYTFDDYYYPIEGKEEDPCGLTEEDIEVLSATLSAQLLEKEFPCRYEHLHFDRGKITLDAETALKFVRSRHSDINGGDFGRSLRQQAFIEAVKDELLSIGGLTKIIPIANKISDNVLTDINLKEGYDLAKDKSLDDIKIDTISLTTDNVLEETYSSNGQYILKPESWDDKKWGLIHEYLKESLSKYSNDLN